MTPAETAALHAHLDERGYPADEFAADMWAFIYGVYDELTARGWKTADVYHAVREALDIEHQRVKVGSK